MTKTEDDIVENHRPKVYKRDVDDIMNRKQNQVDVWFCDLNNYRHNID